MILFHHWPVDRATGLAPAVSSLGTKRVAPTPRPEERIFLERPTGLAPVSRVWKTRALLLSYGRMRMDIGWTPRCSPPMESTPPFRCVPARLSKGVPLPRHLRAEDFRYSSGPREIPMATGRGQTKNPALVSEGGVFCPVWGQISSSSCVTPHLAPRFPSLATENRAHGFRTTQPQAWQSEDGARLSPGQLPGSRISRHDAGPCLHGSLSPWVLSRSNPDI